MLSHSLCRNAILFIIQTLYHNTHHAYSFAQQCYFLSARIDGITMCFVLAALLDFCGRRYCIYLCPFANMFFNQTYQGILSYNMNRNRYKIEQFYHFNHVITIQIKIFLQKDLFSCSSYIQCNVYFCISAYIDSDDIIYVKIGVS